jgi:predicted ATPase
MLQTIREYAHELLEGGSEGDAIRRRHADHYHAVSELAYTQRFDRGLTWVRRLEAEHDNFRAALDHLQDRHPLRALQLAGALGWFWLARSHFAEGARRLEDALSSTVDEGPLTARALTSLGYVDTDETNSLRRHEHAVQLWLNLGGRDGVGGCR